MSRAKPTINQIKNLESELNSKQDNLVSGINIKTINGSSVLGSGDLVINTGITDHGALTGLGDDDHTQYHNDTRGDVRYYTKTQLDGGQLDNRYYTETETNTLLNGKANTTHNHIINDVIGLQTALDGKQETLFSGTNIKTINGTSILGSGDLVIDTGAVSLDNYKKVENLVYRATTIFDSGFYHQPSENEIVHSGSLSEIPRSEAFLGNNKSSPIPKFHLKASSSANSIASYSSVRTSYPSFIEHYGGAKFALHMKFGGSNSNPDSEKNYIGFFGLNQLNNDVDSIFGGTNNNFQHNLSNAIGVGWRTTDTNLQIIYLNASDVITFIDLGSNFKAPPQRNSEYYLYELIIKRKTNDLNVFDIIIIDINTGNTTTNTITTKVSGLELSGIVMAIKNVGGSSGFLSIALSSVELYKWYY